MMQRARAWRAPVALVTLLGAAGLLACHAPQSGDVEVEVRSVGLDAASNAPVVVLQDHDRKVALPIWIGPSEAQAIAMQMQGVTAPRPLTHDLIKTILDDAGIRFDKAVIRALKNDTYYASIYLHAGRQDLQIDSRPSDAIALAVRFHRPIFVTAALLRNDNSVDLQHAAPGADAVTVAGITAQNLTDALAEYFNLPPGHGVIVSQIAREAPPGLHRGDIILQIDGAAVSGVGDFDTKMQGLARGQSAHLVVQRGTQRLSVALTGRG